MASRAEQLVKRYDTLKDRDGVARGVWQELADYIMPTRRNITAKRTPGSKQTDKLFDSTAPNSAINLAAFIGGSITNMAIQWFSLKLHVEELNQDKDIASWLEECASIIYLSLRQSNFDTESQELYIDLSVFGMGALLVDEKANGGYQFRSEAIGTYVVAEDADGLVDTIFRRVEMSISAAAKKWGVEKLSTKSQEKLKKNPDEMLEIIHAVIPRHSTPGKLKGNKPYGSYYFEYEHKHLIDEGGYDEMPFMVPRWSKTSGEVTGRGPGHIALPDIKTLNKADELTLRGWAKIIAPPLKAREDGVVGRVRTQPEAITIVRDMDALNPMEQGGKWDVNAALTTDRRASIRRYFFADQLQLPDKTIITATEVDRRIELAQQILGPTVGRLAYEYLNPLISRLFKIKLRRKEFPQIPAPLAQYAQEKGLEIDVQYEGPLSRAQRGNELAAFQKAVQTAGLVLQANPNSRIMDRLDEDKAFDKIVEWTGTTKAIVRSDKDTQEIRATAAQAVQQAQTQESLNTAADTTQKLAGASASMSEGQPGASPYGEEVQST